MFFSGPSGTRRVFQKAHYRGIVTLLVHLPCTRRPTTSSVARNVYIFYSGPSGTHSCSKRITISTLMFQKDHYTRIYAALKTRNNAYVMQFVNYTNGIRRSRLRAARAI